MANENYSIASNVKLFQNGQELGDEIMPYVRTVTVEDEVNLPTRFSIGIGMQNIQEGDWRGIDMTQFTLGNEITVEMGPDETLELVTGEITAIEPSFGEPSILEISGFDRLHRLRFGTYRRSFQDVKDSDLASTFASDAGLSADAEDTATVYPYLLQNNLSNYHFLLQRAKRIDFELAAEDKTLIFKPSNEAEGAELTLEYGIDMMQFRAKLSALPIGGEVEVRGWDVAQKAEVVGTAADGSEQSLMGGKKSGYGHGSSFEPSVTAITREHIIDAQHAETLAKAMYNAKLKEFITGQGQCSGNPDIRRRKTIELTGLGDAFTGTYYIIGSKHVYNYGEGYLTTFKVRRTGI